MATKPTTKGKKTAMVASFPEPANKQRAKALAAFVTLPCTAAAAVMCEYTKGVGDQDLWALAEQVQDGTAKITKGDMRSAEAMLYGQAHALQAIFMNLARRAASQEYLKQWEAYLRMAMKAQNQCRMTLETLATIKNPPVVFARQANINNGGQQQVNNGAQAEATRAHAAKIESEQSKLLPDPPQNGVQGGQHNEVNSHSDTLTAQGID
jgi:hypothetical protein